MRNLVANLVIAVLVFYSATSSQNLKNPNPWKGNAILGNGNLTVVYSDDNRVSSQSGGKGIQHLYFKDYTIDYIASTEFHLYDEKGNPIESAFDSVSIGMKNFFTTSSKSFLTNEIIKEVNCFVLDNDAVVLSLKAAGMNKLLSYSFAIKLRKNFVSSLTNSIKKIDVNDETANAVWQNNVCLSAGASIPGQKYSVIDSVIIISGTINPNITLEIILSVSPNLSASLKRIQELRQKKDLQAVAYKYWNAWMNSGLLPNIKMCDSEKHYLDFYKRNLYAAKSACLNGQIPADITGQFVTNNMPQLYPRDAMMVARVFLLTGHFKEAKQVIEFWAGKEIPQKSDGEFYARYDAYANAVDGGSGARYDEPEWDANGYFIQLVYEYYKQKKVWLANKSLIYELADFLTRSISSNGLLYEGGIVEWTGFLPSTNMICASALITASQIASLNGDKDKSKNYLIAGNMISSNLNKMFDAKNNTYASLRYYYYKDEDNKSLTKPTDSLIFLWDTSTLFGFVWGYPNHKELELSYKFYLDHAMKMNGGMQYFDSPDPGLAAYGHDLFFFTTAAASYYQIKIGNRMNAKMHIDWMINNSNIYGLMPERIYLNQTDCSPASPLSWCCAEFAACLLNYFKK
jgi:GH15 family glucan-1,4-alpha-glucosidase